MIDRRRHSDRMLVLIDESGDPGFKLSKGSASVFVAVLVAFRDREDARQTQGAKVVIDGSGDREFRQELGAYLRQHCGAGAIKHVRFADSANDRLIQLADMCAGAIARSYKRDRSDADRWRGMFAPKIDDVWEFR